MVNYEEQIKAFEDELRKTPYNKATQHHIGLVKAKIARLREKAIARASGGKKGEGYAVKKAGDATAVIIGFPSVGKSTLLNKITDAQSKVASYDFTTLTVIPGTMHYQNAKIQVLDVPGIIHGAASGKGKGKEVLGVVRSADLILLLIDIQHPGHKKVLIKELYDAGIRLNEKKPDVRIRKNPKGGMSIASTVKLTKVDKQTIKDILLEFKMNNADIVIRENISVDQLIDVIEGNKIYLAAVTVLNKIDMVNEKKLGEIKRAVEPDICISAEQGLHIEELQELLFQRLNLMRLYCKEVGKKADLEIPMIIRKNATVKDLCEKLHKDFVAKFRFARLWGKSAKFPGQRFQLSHVLMDGDIVEVHLR